MDNDINYTNYKLIATAEDNIRLDKFIAKHVPSLSRTRIKTLVEAGHLLVNGEIIKDCSVSVKPAKIYQLNVPDAEPSTLVAKHIPLDIVYEDKYLLVINKQAGLTVHPGAGNYQNTLANALMAHCDNLSGIGGVMRPGIVHRLDKDTSGLLVVAKDDQTHISLSDQLQKRTLTRIYLSLIWGLLSPLAGTLQGNIARSYRNRTKMTLVKSGGKEATTHYKTVEILGKGVISMIECKLETGRTHQIRVHCSEAGHSLVGDQTYGSFRKKQILSLPPETQQALVDFKRQALHSSAIKFIHPATDELIEFKIDLPVDMQHLISLLRTS
jgi:23S rRNA pseudouridine1911/1915/1917 synthase